MFYGTLLRLAAIALTLVGMHYGNGLKDSVDVYAVLHLFMLSILLILLFITAVAGIKFDTSKIRLKFISALLSLVILALLIYKGSLVIATLFGLALLAQCAISNVMRDTSIKND